MAFSAAISCHDNARPFLTLAMAIYLFKRPINTSINTKEATYKYTKQLTMKIVHSFPVHPLLTEKTISHPPKGVEHALQLKEYMALKANQVKEALDEAVCLQHSLLVGEKHVHLFLCLASCEVNGDGSSEISSAHTLGMIHTMSRIHGSSLNGSDLRGGFGEGTAFFLQLICTSLKGLEDLSIRILAGLIDNLLAKV